MITECATAARRVPVSRREPWLGGEVVATGHLSRDEPLEIGDRLEICGQPGIVRTTEPLLCEREVRLIEHRRSPIPSAR